MSFMELQLLLRGMVSFAKTITRIIGITKNVLERGCAAENYRLFCGITFAIL
jgi:hypothetical protein